MFLITGTTFFKKGGDLFTPVTRDKTLLHLKISILNYLYIAKRLKSKPS